MYLGGYGNFVSTSGTIGVTLTKHLSLNAGYQFGSRLVVNSSSSSNRIGVRLTQKGANRRTRVFFLGERGWI
jgi:hypothetical protein